MKTRTKAAIQSQKWREANPERYREGIRKANADKRNDPVKWAKQLEQK